jgi:hypothetical protein
MKVRDFVYDTFLRLTSKTCPYGFEDEFVKDVMPLMFPNGIQKDEWGNYFYKIGESRTIFASHIDTVSKEYLTVTHEFDGNFIKTDGKTTLGADDKAGVTVMLWLMKNNVPGLYYFFIGEEVGCIGSGNAAQYGLFKNKYDRIISFDRRGTNSVITYQSASRCCSDDFADDLCRQFNKFGLSYSKDTGGVYTDSAEFVDIIPECTNISVGYYKEHTTNEHQDIEHLINLCSAVTKVDWENLPTKRDPKVNDHKSYRSYNSYSHHDDWYSDAGFDDYSTKKKKTRRSDKKNKYSSRDSKVYYDSGDDLVEILQKDHRIQGINTNDKYSWILEKFLNDKFTWDDLQIIKSYYLDMNTEYDKYFYQYLSEQVIDC